MKTRKLTQEIGSIIKNFPKNKSPRSNVFTSKFYQTLEEELMLKHFSLTTGDGTFPNSFYEACITLIPKPKMLQEKETRV